MTTSDFDAFRPPEPEGRRRRGGARGTGQRRRTSGGDGGREMPMVPEVEFESYYGRPVVKAPPWGEEIPAYLFLGGVAGGSALLAAGAQFTRRPRLRRNSRLSALGAIGVGSLALVADLGRPERFLNMLRTFKVTSPMSVGSWILATFSVGAGAAAAVEVDRMTGSRLPLGPLRSLLPTVDVGGGIWAAVLGAPLAAYTAVLLGDTATPTWNAAHNELPFVFVSSAAMASGGLALLTTPTDETAPARVLAVLGAAGDVAASKVMHRNMDPVVAETLHHGKVGKMLRASEILAVVGGLGAVMGGRHRGVAAVSGLCLLGSSALTRFGIFEAGIESAKDPRYTIEPQKRRLAARRAAGITDDSITTVR
ncbi:nitrite reductase [Nakamurella flava]|uniref:Nitrite reductase n=1 Tax=Nakamurella flava TaxID=2576308 RepID=A0A4V6CSA6_9ACTN|nr:nitrite reductase [Nakamurella flava]